MHFKATSHVMVSCTKLDLALSLHKVRFLMQRNSKQCYLFNAQHNELVLICIAMQHMDSLHVIL
jgi:hypothetical protein